MSKWAKTNIEWIESDNLMYNPYNGEFRWSFNPTKHHGKRPPGELIKGKGHKKGYLTVPFGGKYFVFAHRVAWYLVYGNWPTKQIDHINRDVKDNRIENLREVNQRENSLNRSISTSTPGIRKLGNKYYVRIRTEGKQLQLSCNSFEEASVEYKKLFDKYNV